MMAVAGKGLHEWVAVTLCDFGDPPRRMPVRDHYSIGAALRAYKELCKIYGRTGRCWQETKEGEIINDTGVKK